MTDCDKCVHYSFCQDFYNELPTDIDKINFLTSGCSHFEDTEKIVELDTTSEHDNISHPSHYTYGRIECIDYIRDKQFDFCLGNAIKYITRAGHKGDKIEDLKKAIQYLQFEIEMIEGSENKST